jgi:hypothetical protein
MDSFNNSSNSLIRMDTIHTHHQEAHHHTTTGFSAVQCSLEWKGCLVHMGTAMGMDMRVEVGNHHTMVHLRHHRIEVGNNLRG